MYLISPRRRAVRRGFFVGVNMVAESEKIWLKETFCGHAVVGVMAQDEILLKVFGGPNSLEIATAFCESLASEPDCAKVVKAVAEAFSEFSSHYIGLRIVSIKNGTPGEIAGFFRSRFEDGKPATGSKV